MARVTLKSQAIIISQLTAQVAELTTQVGVLMSQLQAAQQDVPHHLQERIATLVDERNELIIENQRLCDALEAIIASTSAPQPQRQPAPKPLPSPAVVESAPTVEVSDFDRAMWAKFQALPRERRLEIIAFARPEWGHVGIHNIAEVRAAWRAANPISA